MGSVSGRWRRAVLAARGFLSGEGLGGGDDAGGRRVGFLEVILFFVGKNFKVFRNNEFVHAPTKKIFMHSGLNVM